MSEQKPIRIVVADGHPLFTLGVKALLARDPDFEIVGDADDGEETLALVERLRPDVLMLDLALGRLSGLEVLRRMAGMHLATRILIVTAAIERADLRIALLRGAQGVLLKHLASDLLIKCLKQVVKGEYWIGRDSVGDLIDAMRNPSPREEAQLLSQRERDIVSAVIKGASNKDIAWQLGLGEQTVKNHLRRIFAKLGVNNRVELAVHAMENELTSPLPKGADLPVR
jgi:DNA-binding NarL/FixJ family response regulator